MLQDIRKNIQGTMAKVIVGIIIIPFAFFGIESLVGGGGVSSVAQVNGTSITGPELQVEVNQQKRRLLAQMGEQIDPAMLDDQALSGPALEFLVQKQLLLQSADSYGLNVSDQRLGEIVSEIPAFQVEGRFNPDLYRRVLADQGYSTGGFKETLRQDLMMTQLRTGLSASEFVTPAEVSQFAGFSEQQRDLRYLIMPLDDYRANAEISDAQVTAWYEANGDRYVTDESVVLEYIELSAEDLYGEVDEAELLERFEIDRANFERAEERAVSHILLEAADEDDEQVLARLQSIQNELMADASNFAALAELYSEDVGSANFGGELGFTNGESFPAELEAVIATLEEGQVSDPVRSVSGWHLLQVTEIRGITFEEVRVELQEQVQQERASAELVKQVEALKDLVFNAEDLAGPAAELELTVLTSEPVTRSQGSGVFADARLQAVAFSSELLNDGYNSEVIEIERDRFVVLRVAEHRLPEAVPLEAVAAEIFDELAEEQARAAIRIQADEFLVALREGASIENLALEYDFEWQVELGARRDSPVLPQSLLQRAFQLPDSAEGTFEYVQNTDGDIEMFELVRVIPYAAGSLAESRQDMIERSLLNQTGRNIDAQFQEQLRSSADISLL